MGLFSKSKETADLKQAQEIKDVSTELSNPSMPANLPDLDVSGQPALNLNQDNTQTTNVQSNFNNPFAQNNATQPNIEQPQTNQATQPTQNQTPIPQAIQPTNPTPEPIGQPTEQQTPNQTIPPINDLVPQANQTEQPMPSEIPQTPQQNSIFNTNQQANSQPPQNSQLPSDIPNQPTNPQATQQTQNQTPQNIISQEKEVLTKDRIQELVDETVEQVIEERWQQIVQKIEKVAQWKDKQEQHINLIKEDILTMKESFEKLEKRIINKVSDYDKNILDVNSEIKALEKVFQKITPTLVNNVNELSNIAKTFKPESKTENIE